MKADDSKKMSFKDFLKDFFGDIVLLFSDKKWLLRSLSLYIVLIMLFNIGMIYLSFNVSYFYVFFEKGLLEKVNNKEIISFSIYVLFFISTVLLISGMFVNILKKILYGENRGFNPFKIPEIKVFLRIFQIFIYIAVVIITVSGIFLKAADFFGTSRLLKSVLGNAILFTFILIAVVKASLVLPAAADGQSMGLFKSIIKTSGYEFYLFSISLIFAIILLVLPYLSEALFFQIEVASSFVACLFIIFSLFMNVLKQLIFSVLMIRVYKYFKDNNLLA